MSASAGICAKEVLSFQMLIVQGEIEPARSSWPGGPGRGIPLAVDDVFGRKLASGSVLCYRSRREAGKAPQDAMGLECRKFTGKCC